MSLEEKGGNLTKRGNSVIPGKPRFLLHRAKPKVEIDKTEQGSFIKGLDEDWKSQSVA